MDDIEDFIITESYNVTEEDELAFHQASPDKKDKDHWDKGCLDGFKKRFRDDMLIKQNYICSYCRLDLHSNEATPEIDHIVPKSEKPDWMYEPFNLCMSCKMCNTKKNTKEVLRDNTVADLPYENYLEQPVTNMYKGYEFVKTSIQNYYNLNLFL